MIPEIYYSWGGPFNTTSKEKTKAISQKTRSDPGHSPRNNSLPSDRRLPKGGSLLTATGDKSI